jgi:hypothetical protein
MGELTRFYSDLSDKYRRAASRPWMIVPPDPPALDLTNLPIPLSPRILSSVGTRPSAKKSALTPPTASPPSPPPPPGGPATSPSARLSG